MENRSGLRLYVLRHLPITILRADTIRSVVNYAARRENDMGLSRNSIRVDSLLWINGRHVQWTNSTLTGPNIGSYYRSNRYDQYEKPAEDVCHYFG